MISLYEVLAAWTTSVGYLQGGMTHEWLKTTNLGNRVSILIRILLQCPFPIRFNGNYLC